MEPGDEAKAWLQLLLPVSIALARGVKKCLITNPALSTLGFSQSVKFHDCSKVLLLFRSYSAVEVMEDVQIINYPFGNEGPL